MYKTFFGLRENPFNINPDPRFLFLTSQTQQVLDQLTYGIQNRKGCVLLTGEVGTGKTTLVNYLLDWLRREKMPTAFIFNSHLSVNHLFDFILTDFGVPVDFRLRGNMLLQLTKWLMERFRAGETPVLILDEAQGLSFELMEEVRLLLNLETSSEKLLQIVLVGQPELEDKLKRPELRQFRQRIALRCSTAPLSLEESFGYISDRLRIAGAAGESVFTPSAVEALHFYSRGIPRVLNILCEHALINAYAGQCNPVPVEMVEEAARDFLLEESRPATTPLNSGNRGNSKVTVMQSAFAGELLKSFQVDGPNSQLPVHPTPPDAAGEVVVSDAGPTSFDVAVRERQAMSAFEGNQDECVARGNLGSGLPDANAREQETMQCEESVELPSDPAARLVAEMKRLLAAVSPVSSLRVVPARSGRRESKAGATTSVATPVNDQLRAKRIPRTSIGDTIYAMLLSWKSQTSYGATNSLCFISLTAWLRRPVTDPQRIREWAAPIQALLRRWAFEFKRDWAEMINSMRLREMERSFRYWLHQPLGANHWGQTKASPLGSRRGLHR